MDGYRWARETCREAEECDWDDVHLYEGGLAGHDWISVPVERLGEFAAWVASIAAEVAGDDAGCGDGSAVGRMVRHRAARER